MKLLNKMFGVKKEMKSTDLEDGKANAKNLVENVIREKGWVVFATRLHPDADADGGDRLSSYMVIGGAYKHADLSIAIEEYNGMVKRYLTQNMAVTSKNVNSQGQEQETPQIEP